MESRSQRRVARASLPPPRLLPTPRLTSPPQRVARHNQSLAKSLRHRVQHATHAHVARLQAEDLATTRQRAREYVTAINERRDKEMERLRTEWEARNKLLWEHIEGVIGKEEERARAAQEAERKKREEEERVRREEEERRRKGEEEKRREEEERRKEREREEEEARQASEAEKAEKARKEKEEQEAEQRKELGFLSASEDWQKARQDLMVRHSRFSELHFAHSPLVAENGAHEDRQREQGAQVALERRAARHHAQSRAAHQRPSDHHPDLARSRRSRARLTAAPRARLLRAPLLARKSHPPPGRDRSDGREAERTPARTGRRTRAGRARRVRRGVLGEARAARGRVARPRRRAVRGHRRARVRGGGAAQGAWVPRGGGLRGVHGARDRPYARVFSCVVCGRGRGAARACV